jgi:Flp pilus assembly secretin CpaC
MVAVANRTQASPSGSRVNAALIVPASLAGQSGQEQQSRVSESGPSMPVHDTIVCDANDVTSLTVDGIIEAVRVEDDSVARVISSTSRHLRLIGVRPGKTRVLVQQKVAGRDASLREIYELHVGSSSNVRGGESQQEQSLMELIEQKFSTASVQVTRQGDRIIVQGECDDARDAKEIVRLIRKTFLVPVEDQLILR